mmetsp:Transcript_35657/g.75952  ORF Transcript_35657/g.75952 Transcript_35657/m.75952 type:complete len:225 (-) Transcript_35657:2887-3561(-)
MRCRKSFASHLASARAFPMSSSMRPSTSASFSSRALRFLLGACASTSPMAPSRSDKARTFPLVSARSALCLLMSPSTPSTLAAKSSNLPCVCKRTFSSMSSAVSDLPLASTRSSIDFRRSANLLGSSSVPFGAASAGTLCLVFSTRSSMAFRRSANLLGIASVSCTATTFCTWTSKALILPEISLMESGASALSFSSASSFADNAAMRSESSFWERSATSLASA